MDNQEKSNSLEKESIQKLMWSYFVPAFIGVIANSLYNIIDRIFIGQNVSVYALSALSIVFPIMLIIAAFGILIGMGSGIYISINMGKQNITKARYVIGNAISLMVIFSSLVTILGFIIKDPILTLFGATDQTLAYANQYLSIVLLGSIFQILGFGLNIIIRSEGNANIAMYSMVASILINITLDYLFILVFEWGVKGAALATVISQIVLSIIGLIHFRSKRAIISQYNLCDLKLNHVIIGRILALGIAPFTMQLGASSVQTILNYQLIKYGGDVAVGALGIILSITILAFMSMLAINMATQPIIGYNYGAGKYNRVKETWILAIKSATFIAVNCCILINIFPKQIIRMFNTDNNEILILGEHGLIIFTILLPITGLHVVTGSYFQSIGKVKIGMFLSMLRHLLIPIPMLIILPQYFGLDGVWMVVPVADGISTITAIIFSIREFRFLNYHIRKIQENY